MTSIRPRANNLLHRELGTLRNQLASIADVKGELEGINSGIATLNLEGFAVFDRRLRALDVSLAHLDSNLQKELRQIANSLPAPARTAVPADENCLRALGVIFNLGTLLLDPTLGGLIPESRKTKNELNLESYRGTAAVECLLGYLQEEPELAASLKACLQSIDESSPELCAKRVTQLLNLIDRLLVWCQHQAPEPQTSAV